METVNIHEAKTHLSKLLERVQAGEPFIIAKAGKPIAKVVSVDTQDADTESRLGFLCGQIKVPDDFNTMGDSAILDQFGLGDESDS